MVALPATFAPHAAAEAAPRRRRVTRARRARPATLDGGDKAGAWRVEGQLGRGGMASVYAVTHTKFGKRAALKLAHREILGKGFTPDAFLREARVVNLVDHACVPDVFATGTYDGRPYLVMERLTGQTLGQRLDGGPMPHAAAINVLLELCDVLRAAHEACIVHRDLKLDNVFLLAAPCAGGHRVKLLDWGVAHVIGEPDPLAGFIAGTLTYIAPEQVRGDGVTPAADVYSLAVLAYLMLFGAPPFVARDDLALIKLHLHTLPPAPQTLCPDVNPELAVLLAAMLAKAPVDRPALPEVVRVLSKVRDDIAAATKPKARVHAAPTQPPCDPFGRPSLRLTAKGKRLIAVTMGLFVALSSLSGWM